jgi:methyl-accepting chemotaxis protein
MPFLSSITGRLLIVTLTLTLALVVSAFYSNHQLQLISENTRRTGDNRIPQLSQMAELELQVTRVSLQLRHAMLARSQEERAAAVTDIGQRKQRIKVLLDDYESKLFTDTGRKRFQPVRPAMETFWRIGAENIRLIEAGQKDSAFAHLVEQAIPARNALLKQLSDTVQYQRDSTLKDMAAIERSVHQTRVVLISLFALVCVGLLGFSWWANRAISSRIQASRSVIERVRDGDLSKPITTDRQDEFKPLLQALHDMQEGLGQVVRDVRRHADHVANTSTTIAEGSQSLSERTDNQSQALLRTASTMEQLGQAVKTNTEHAAQAAEMAQQASEVARQGGMAVQNVVETMRGIHEASRKISEIISVIDGIAFQTNILALNAAVEAARAGENGRGFAVVAGEVRTLAQRSAGAAREIRSLITVSGEQVEKGSKLVEHAGDTMTQIVGAIEQVTGIVQDISRASAEQHTGVTVVGQAVHDMDSATQQNLNLVQQSTQAAGNLQAQSKALVDSVAVFKVG